MNKLSERFRRESMMRRLSVISIIAAAVLVFTFFIALMYEFELIELPDFVSGLLGQPGVDTVEVIPGDDGSIYDALMQKKAAPGVTVTRNINAADAAVFFTELKPSEEYSVFNRVTLYADNKSLVLRNKIWRQGMRYRIETYDVNNALLKTILCDGTNVYVTERAGENETGRIFPVSDGFTLEQQAGMPSVEDIRVLLAGSSGENSEPEQDIDNISVSLVRTAENSVYHVEYDYMNLLLHEQLYISLENGFVVHAETRETSGNLTYSLETDFMQTGITGYAGINIFTPET